MSFNNFESLIGILAGTGGNNPYHALTVRYGINLDIKMKIMSNGTGGSYTSKGKRKGAFFGNDVSMLGMVNPVMENDLDIYDGYSNRMVNTEGRPDSILITEALKDFSLHRPQTAIQLQKLFDEYEYRENVVSLLYNLLRMYYIKENNNIEYLNQAPYYNDGHVFINNNDIFSCQVDGNIDNISFTPIRTNILTDIPDVVNNQMCFLNLRNFTHRMRSVLNLAAGEWQNNDRIPIQLFHASPQLTEEILTFERILNNDLGDVDFNDISQGDIINTIRQLVYNNRLQGQFDCAYGMVVQIIFNHKPRSAEGMIWQAVPSQIVMAPACSMRGLSQAVMSGSALTTDTKRFMTYGNWLRYPKRAYIHSIGLSEAACCSAFEVTNTEKDEYEPYKMTIREELENRISGHYQVIDTGLILDLELAGMRVQKELVGPWPTRLGLHRFNRLFYMDQQVQMPIQIVIGADVRQYNIQMVIDEIMPAGQFGPPRGHVTILLNYIPPICYPVLSMNKNDDGYYQNKTNVKAKMIKIQGRHLAGMQDMYVCRDSKNMNKFMQSMRVCGYDIIGRTSMSTEQFRNWAPNVDGQALVNLPPLDDELQYYYIHANEINQRRNNWIELPNLQDNIEVELDMDIQRFSLFVNGVKQATIGVSVQVMKFDEKEVNKSVSRMEKVYYSTYEIRPININMEYTNFQMLMEAANYQANLSLQQQLNV